LTTSLSVILTKVHFSRCFRNPDFYSFVCAFQQFLAGHYSQLLLFLSIARSVTATCFAVQSGIWNSHYPYSVIEVAFASLVFISTSLIGAVPVEAAVAPIQDLSAASPSFINAISAIGSSKTRHGIIISDFVSAPITSASLSWPLLAAAAPWHATHQVFYLLN